MTGTRTLIDLLRRRAIQVPGATAYAFLSENGESDLRISYQELDQRARSIGAHLQARRLEAGQPVMLLVQPGLDYVAAFFGCLYGGAVPVPAYPPVRGRQLSRLQSIMLDAGATTACTTATDYRLITRLEHRDANISVSDWVVTDSLADKADSWKNPEIGEDSLAFLQYTSGSTAVPKGVMVTHRNVLANLERIGDRIQARADDVSVFWLPPYHDFGLIGAILYPLFWRQPGILMRPTSFLQNPYRWVKAIHDYGATITGAPNFAYDLCARKTTPEQRSKLDLSRLRVAFNGGEPVRETTLRNFQMTFAASGFCPQAWLPAYGLAECTLMASGCLRHNSAAWPATLTVSKQALSRRQVTPARNQDSVMLTSAGPVLGAHEAAVVDPDTRRQCRTDEVGEIWLQGPSVARGYWNRPEETREAFGASIAGSDRGPYLRTGDLGFIHAGELYVCGRSKDLIIRGGRNIYPQDVERASFESDPRLRRDSAAAFSRTTEVREELCIAQELEFRASADPQLFGTIAASILESVGTPPDVILLLKPGGIPRTPSGKVQRRLCAERYQDGSLSLLARWTRPWINSAVMPHPNASHLAGATGISAELHSQLSRLLKVDMDSIDPEEPFALYGMDSVTALQLADALAQWLGYPVSPTLFWDYPTIAKLSEYLADQRSGPSRFEAPAA